MSHKPKVDRIVVDHRMFVSMPAMHVVTDDYGSDLRVPGLHDSIVQPIFPAMAIVSTPINPL